MSRSSVREGAAGGHRPRGQVEPVAALAAVLVVGIALSTYAGLLPGTAGTTGGTADATLTRAYGTVTETGVVVPGRLRAATDVAPPGHGVNVTLSVGSLHLHAGPTPPPSAERATRRASVRVGPGAVRPGHLSVEVWG